MSKMKTSTMQARLSREVIPLPHERRVRYLEDGSILQLLKKLEWMDPGKQWEAFPMPFIDMGVMALGGSANRKSFFFGICEYVMPFSVGQSLTLNLMSVLFFTIKLYVLGMTAAKTAPPEKK